MNSVERKSGIHVSKYAMGQDLVVYTTIDGEEYRYHHDQLVQQALDHGKLTGTKSWDIWGQYGWSNIPQWMYSAMHRRLGP